MVYLESFKVPKRQNEEAYFFRFHETCYTDFYPFGVFRNRKLPQFIFEPITIFYGGNGSGKSTLLNVIAEKLQLERNAPFNRSSFFEDYVSLCQYEISPSRRIPVSSRIITSDDVFDYLLDIRSINEGIDTKRKELMKNYAQYRHADNPLRSLDDYEEWKKVADAQDKRTSRSKYVKEHLVRNVTERSNGESALMYFTEAVKEDALYLLDEPENSLSASLQLKLKQFIEDSARFFGCQFILSTHSPFLLSIPGAKIYDLDVTPPQVRKWTELENVKVYWDFFREHVDQFL